MILQRCAVDGDANRASGPAPRRLPSTTSSHDPARRLEDVGVRALSARELIALLLAPGRTRHRAQQAAAAITEHFLSHDGYLRLRLVARADVAEVARVGGIGRAAAARLIAGLELGLRASQEALLDRDRVSTARDVYERMRLRVRDLPHEELWLLVLNTQHEILREVCVTRGLLNETLVHPREIFRLAILESASAVVLVHNHPSGEPSPSPDDDIVTAGLVASGHTLGICVIDHIIVGEGRYYSYNEAERLPPPPPFSFAWGKERRLRIERPRKRRSRTKRPDSARTRKSHRKPAAAE